MTQQSLAGRVAIVTGGGSGIGLAITERLCAAGAHVVVADVRPPPSGGTITGITCDVAVESDIVRVVDAANEIGAICALVTSAGYTMKSPIDQMELSEWQRILDVNLTGTMLAIKHVVPSMRASGGGSIVTIASIASFLTTSTNNAAYAATKGAIAAMTRALVSELSPDSIRINAVAPGITATPLVAKFGPEWATSRARMVPLGRLADPEEIANVALFLASEDSSYVTGQMLIVDGGTTAVNVAPSDRIEG